MEDEHKLELLNPSIADPRIPSSSSNELKFYAIDSIESVMSPQDNQMCTTTKSKRAIIIGVLLMFASGLLYSGLATLVRWGSMLGYSAAEILVYRSSVQIIVAITAYRINHTKQHRPHLNRAAMTAVIGRGIFGAFSTFTYFESTTLIPVGDVVTLKGLAAVLTSFAGYFILNESLTTTHMLALLCSFIAALLVTQPPMIFGDVTGNKDTFLTDDLPGYLVAIASSCFQCGIYICIKLAVGAPAVLLMLSQGICSWLLSVLILIVWEKEVHLFKDNTWQEYVCVAGICCIGYASQWTLTRGGQLLIAALASLMRTTDIAWAFLWEMVFFSQIPDLLTILGAVAMFCSVFMVSMEKIKTASENVKRIK
eukprot:40645_1